MGSVCINSWPKRPFPLFSAYTIYKEPEGSLISRW